MFYQNFKYRLGVGKLVCHNHDSSFLGFYPIFKFGECFGAERRFLLLCPLDLDAEYHQTLPGYPTRNFSEPLGHTAKQYFQNHS